ncbi:hypothetical protein ACQPZ2_37885 [Nocardia pseudovaccinii]
MDQPWKTQNNSGEFVIIRTDRPDYYCGLHHSVINNAVSGGADLDGLVRW